MPTRILIIAILVALGLYGLVEARPLLLGPSLTLAEPMPGEATTSPVTVSGSVSRIVSLALDGSPLIPDQDGSFSAILALPQGSVILSLTAADRFGRTITRTRTIIVN